MCAAVTPDIQNSINMGEEVMEDPPPYRVVEVDGKGRGLLATRELEVGELVMSEKPLVMVQGQPTVAKIRRMLDKVKKLPKEKRLKIMALTDPGEEDRTFDNLHLDPNGLRVARRFNANCHGVGEHATALYENISIINHSCSPNVFWVDGRDGVSLEVRVCRRIEEGEEILASYFVFPDFPLREERQEKIWRSRYFQCLCDICSLEKEEFKKDEEARKVIKVLHDEVARLYNTSGASAAFRAAEQKLEEMEKVRESMALRLPEAMLECFNLAAMAGEREKRVEYKERALEVAQRLSNGHREKAEERIRRVEMEVAMSRATSSESRKRKMVVVVKNLVLVSIVILAITCIFQF